MRVKGCLKLMHTVSRQYVLELYYASVWNPNSLLILSTNRQHNVIIKNE